MIHRLVLGLSILFVIGTAKADGISMQSCHDSNCLLDEFQTNAEGQWPLKGVYSGSYNSPIREACHFSQFEKTLNESYDSTADYAESVSEWFADCEPELARLHSLSFLSMLNLSQVDYPFEDNPKLQNVEFIYDGDTKIRGILALKDNKKRPLVIVKNGVFGNAEGSTSIQTMLMHLSEEAPFHVLALGNVTGDDFIKDNGFIAVGGFEEGRQIHEVVKIIRSDQSPIKDLIYDVHMMGISLGGNAALFSSLYNSYIEEPKHRIQSHIAYCPVVNLKKSLNHVYRPSGLGFFFSFITKGLLKDIFQFVPDLWDIFDPDDKIKRSETKKILVEGALKSIKERTEENPWDYKPFEGNVINNLEEFWQHNDFTNYYDQVDSSTLVVHSQNDFVVKSKDNANQLRNIASNNNKNLGFINLNKGGHCAFSVSYGWPTISKLLKNYVLQNSDYIEKEEQVISSIDYVKRPRANPRYKFSNYEWVYNNKRQAFDLDITYRIDHKPTARGNQRCRAQDYRFSDFVCYYTRSYPVSDTIFRKLELSKPTSPYELAYISRWFNTHVVPITNKYEIPYGKGEVPTYFKAKK